MKHHILAGVLLLIGIPSLATAQEKIELESIYIRGNKEFPQILYIVPWKDMKSKGHQKQTLVLHSLFGDLFDPVYQEVTQGVQSQASKK